MRILISGSTGFLGTALVEALQRQGHSIARLVRPGTTQKSAAGVLHANRPVGPGRGPIRRGRALRARTRSFISRVRPSPAGVGTPRARNCCEPAGSMPRGT